MTDTITIKKTEYFALKKSDMELYRLNAAGVDNWEGRSMAYGTEIFDTDFYDDVQQLEEELFGKKEVS